MKTVIQGRKATDTLLRWLPLSETSFQVIWKCPPAGKEFLKGKFSVL